MQAVFLFFTLRNNAPNMRGKVTRVYFPQALYCRRVSDMAGVICPPVFEIRPRPKYRIALHPHN